MSVPVRPRRVRVPLHNARFKTAYFAWSTALLACFWVLSTLDSPLARPWATHAARTAYTAGFLGLAALIATTPLLSWYHAGLRLDATFVFDVGWRGIMRFGIVVAASAWTRASLGLVRRKNAAFAAAFIAHDAEMVLLLGVTWTLNRFVQNIDPVLWSAIFGLAGITVLVFQGLLLNGMLSTQLFDIDLKIRWGLSRGTVGAIFVAAFFAASETVAALPTPAVGVVAGTMTTALPIVALAPLRRLSEALAGSLVRDATGSPAYRRRREELV